MIRPEYSKKETLGLAYMLNTMTLLKFSDTDVQRGLEYRSSPE